ncbi:MAG: MATE family efflux transporter [bacterium]
MQNYDILSFMLKRMFLKVKKERDLTLGDIPRHLWILSIPLIISNLLQTAFELINMIWVGRLGQVEVAAVAMSSSIIMVVIFIMIGIAIGTMALVSRSIGEKKIGQANKIAMQSLILGFIGSIILGIIGYILSAPLLRLLGAEEAVVAVGTTYLHITFIGIIAMFYANLIAAILQGAGDSITPMIILTISTVLNIILDPLLIYGIGFFPCWGVPGAAVASVIARGIGSLIALEVLLRGRSRLKLRIKDIKIDWDIIKRILNIGIPSSIQTTLRGLMGIALIAVVASFGTAAIAAYGIGFRLNMLLMMPGFAFGMASASMVGQNLGAKKIDRAVKSAWTAVRYYGIFMLVMAFVFFFFAAHLIMIFNHDAEIIKIGSELLMVMAFGTPFTALGLILDRSLSGAGDTVVTMINTLIALWLIQIPLAIYLAHYTSIGIYGIWIATVIAQIVLSALNTARFISGKWKYRHI